MTNHFIIKKSEYNASSNLSRKSFQKLRDTTCLKAKDWVFNEKETFFSQLQPYA